MVRWVQRCWGARACLQASAGLLQLCLAGCGYPILQTAGSGGHGVCRCRRTHPYRRTEGDLNIRCVGVGPGIRDRRAARWEFLRDLLGRCSKPMVLDADALNNLSTSATSGIWHCYSIPWTPHPKRFERLFGPSSDDLERLEMARDQARERQCIIVLKGHYRFIYAWRQGVFQCKPAIRGWRRVAVGMY